MSQTFKYQGRTYEGEQTGIAISGTFSHEGWDIPTNWAVSEDGEKYWMDGGHGGTVRLATREQLLELADSEIDHDEYDRERLYDSVKEPFEPSWCAAAREAGWTPPKKDAGK